MTVGEITISQMIGEIVTDEMIGITIINKTMEEKILEVDKIMAGMTLNREIEIKLRVGRVQKITIVTIQEIEVEIGVETDKCDQELECCLMKEETDQGLGLTLG